MLLTIAPDHDAVACFIADSAPHAPRGFLHAVPITACWNNDRSPRIVMHALQLLTAPNVAVSLVQYVQHQWYKLHVVSAAAGR